MQTFLPYPDFAPSAAVLDDRRLGKQRVEALQILRALHLHDYGWATHPAVLMWRGHTAALVSYGLTIVAAWQARGHGDTTRDNIAEFAGADDPADQVTLAAAGRLPPWLGWEPFHRSHRSALLRKDPGHYRPRFGAAEPDDLDYVWPGPPQPAPPLGERSAWVVRGEIHDVEIAVPRAAGDDPCSPLDARSGRISKRDRQVARLVDELQDGDPLVVPAGDRLLVARLVGPIRIEPSYYRRTVTWLDTIVRADLDFPAALQDPQTVFALWDEPRLSRYDRGAGASPSGR